MRPMFVAGLGWLQLAFKCAVGFGDGDDACVCMMQRVESIGAHQTSG
jgi:hypothetical protein